MQSRTEDRIEMPLIFKFAVLPLFFPGIAILLVWDIRSELSALVTWMMLLLPLLGIWMVLRMRKPLLAFDKTHVEFQSTSLLGGRVRLRLREIRSVTEAPLQLALGARGAQAHSAGARAFHFRMSDGTEHTLRIGMTPELVDRARALIERHLADNGIDLSLTGDESTDPASPRPGEHSAIDYAVIFGVLGAFMLFTLEYFFLAEEYYAGATPWVLIFVVTAAVSILVVGAFRKYAESREDLAKIALVAIVSAGFLSYALLPRINKWTDGEGLQVIEYTLGADRVWHATDPDLPTFDFGGRDKFWDAIEPGTRKQFDLRRGGLGFWQINMARLYAEQKNFYLSR